MVWCSRLDRLPPPLWRPNPLLPLLSFRLCLLRAACDSSGLKGLLSFDFSLFSPFKYSLSTEISSLSVFNQVKTSNLFFFIDSSHAWLCQNLEYNCLRWNCPCVGSLCCGPGSDGRVCLQRSRSLRLRQPQQASAAIYAPYCACAVYSTTRESSYQKGFQVYSEIT